MNKPTIQDRISVYKKLISCLKETTVSESPEGEFDVVHQGFYVYHLMSYFYKNELTENEYNIMSESSEIIDIKPTFLLCYTLIAAETQYDLFRADLINKLEKSVEIWNNQIK